MLVLLPMFHCSFANTITNVMSSPNTCRSFKTSDELLFCTIFSDLSPRIVSFFCLSFFFSLFHYFSRSTFLPAEHPEGAWQHVWSVHLGWSSARPKDLEWWTLASVTSCSLTTHRTIALLRLCVQWLWSSILGHLVSLSPVFYLVIMAHSSLTTVTFDLCPLIAVAFSQHFLSALNRTC